jgi:hypothetical protein
MMINRFIALFVVCMAVSGVVSAANQPFRVELDQSRVYPGEPVYLRMHFEGTQDIPVPQIANAGDYTAQYIGPSTQISIVNGKSSSSVSHTFLLMPSKTGQITIGPFSFDYKGTTYTSNSIVLQVVDEGVDETGSSSDQRRLDERLFATIETDRAIVYPGQPFTLSVTLYIDQVNVSNIQYPDLTGIPIAVGDFEQPQRGQLEREGRLYRVIRFPIPATARSAGELALGPVKIRCDLLIPRQGGRRSRLHGSLFGDIDSMFDDFFGAGVTAQPIDVASDTARLTVLPLPEEGRPQGFAGAIGNFTLDAEVSSSEVNMGDPVTVKATVTGDGNIDSITSLNFSLPEDEFKVYEPEVAVSGQSKTFTYVVIPRSERVTRIPEIGLNFFDVDQGDYRSVSTGPFALTVNPAPPQSSAQAIMSESESKTEQKEELGQDIAFIKDVPIMLREHGKPLLLSPWFLLLQLLPPAVWLLARGTYHHYRRLQTDDHYARTLRAPRVARQGLREVQQALQAGDAGVFYEVLFKALQRYLGHKLHLPWGGITADVTGELHRRGVDKPISDTIRELFCDCDSARFASSACNSLKMRKSYEDLRTVINHLERTL